MTRDTFSHERVRFTSTMHTDHHFFEFLCSDVLAEPLEHVTEVRVFRRAHHANPTCPKCALRLMWLRANQLGFSFDCDPIFTTSLRWQEQSRVQVATAAPAAYLQMLKDLASDV